MNRPNIIVRLVFVSLVATTIASGQGTQAATDVPQAPPPVHYTVVELGGRRANDISQSGQIVGNKRFVPEISHAAFWHSSRSAAIDLGTLPGLGSVATSSNPRREIVGYAFNDDLSV